jgi:hypothetical protein
MSVVRIALGYRTAIEYAGRKTNQFDGGCAPPNPAPLAAASREFVGVDLTAAMVEKAAAIAGEAGLSNARASRSRTRFVPPLRRTRSTSCLALHHMPDPRAAVREMARFLRPAPVSASST